MFTTLSLSQRRTLALITGVLLLAGLVAVSPTASASHAGDAAGAGQYTYDSVGISRNPPCGEFTDHDGDGTALAYEGTYNGSVTINGETYTGPFTVTFDDNNETWHANPDGLYDPDHPDAPCGGDGTHTIEVADVRVNSPTSPKDDEPGIECGPNNGSGGNNNGELGRTGTMSDITDVKATCTVSDGVESSSGPVNNVDIEIESFFAGPCWRDDAPFLPMPPENCVTEDVISFHP
jgi:hypothetical protein